MSALQKQQDTDSKRMNECIRERDLLRKNVSGGDDRTKKQVELVDRHEMMAGNCGKEVLRWKLTLQNTGSRIAELERDKEKYSKELAAMRAKHEAGQETLRRKEVRTGELRKTISDIRAKLQQQKSLYEAVRTDRNLYSKNLQEALEEISGMKERFRALQHQIETLKEEIRDKDSELIKKHCDHVKVSRDMTRIITILDKTKKRQDQLQKVGGAEVGKRWLGRPEVMGGKRVNAVGGERRRR